MRLFGLRVIDLINPYRWYLFVKGMIIGRFLQMHIIEQLLIRLYDDECRTCVSNGKCHHCGCHMPEKAWNLEDECTNGNWGPVMNKEDWQEYKSQYIDYIDVKITYKKDGTF